MSPISGENEWQIKVQFWSMSTIQNAQKNTKIQFWQNSEKTDIVSHFAMQFCAYLIYKQVSKPQIAAHLTVNRAKKKYYTWMAVFLV